VALASGSVGDGVALLPGFFVGAGVERGLGVAVGLGVGFGVGFGVGVGVGYGLGVGCGFWDGFAASGRSAAGPIGWTAADTILT
jgi:hypothetical protein